MFRRRLRRCQTVETEAKDDVFSTPHFSFVMIATRCERIWGVIRVALSGCVLVLRSPCPICVPADPTVTTVPSLPSSLPVRFRPSRPATELQQAAAAGICDGASTAIAAGTAGRRAGGADDQRRRGSGQPTACTDSAAAAAAGQSASWMQQRHRTAPAPWQRT